MPVRTSFNAVDRDGYRYEYRDCTVVALHHVLNIPYAEAHALAKSAGRKRRRGFNTTKLWGYLHESGYLRKRGLEVFNRGHFPPRRPAMTSARFIKQHPTGRFYVSTWDHAFAIIDGVICESATMEGQSSRGNAKSRIKESWEVV